MTSPDDAASDRAPETPSAPLHLLPISPGGSDKTSTTMSMAPFLDRRETIIYITDPADADEPKPAEQEGVDQQ